MKVDGGPAPAATPMLQQYRALKARYPDALLLFRLGDFYEMFEQDARIGASVLNIALTSREVGKGRRLPMCGVPYHAADHYIPQLVEAGYRVAICEQLEEPGSSRGVVRRDVVRVVTPGTLMEGRAADARERRYLCAVAPGRERVGLAFADVGTGEFRATWVFRRLAPAPTSRREPGGPEGDMEEALRELERLAPSECLVPAGWLAEHPAWKAAVERRVGATVTAWDDGAWHLPTAQAALLGHFRVASLDAFGLHEAVEMVAACGAALRYLQETQRGQLSHLLGIVTYRVDGGLALDPSSALNLELCQTLRQRSRQGSLLSVLDETLTGPGSRLLRRFVEEPLADPRAINRRLDAVEALVRDALLRTRLRRVLQRAPDAERLLARAGCGRAGPRDLAGMREFLARVRELRELFQQAPDVAPLLLPAGPTLPWPDSLAERLERALTEHPPAQAKESGFIRPGYDPELDRLRDGAEEGRRWIATLESRERQRTGIKSLKVAYNRVFGYYIEVTRPNLHLVPPEYERRQTLTGAERFTTPELKEWEARLLEAEERIAAREQALFEELVQQTLSQAVVLRELAYAMACLDVTAALAEVAARRGWVRPVVDDGLDLHIQQGRHPVVEAMAGGAPFVPNDLRLDGQGGRMAIVTGPNMGGKSTFLRQTALIVLLAQMGSFVPAASARIGVADRILTRVGASDDLGSGRSTFLVEMAETAYILRHATPRSLVVLDEVGRGTATLDGLSLAWAIVERLHRMGVRALVATHYHELTRMAERLPGVFNVHLAVERQDGQVVFLRQVRPGPADRSYGIEVARLAGLPEDVVEAAERLLAHLEQERTGPQAPVRWRRKTPALPQGARCGPASQGQLFPG